MIACFHIEDALHKAAYAIVNRVTLTFDLLTWKWYMTHLSLIILFHAPNVMASLISMKHETSTRCRASRSVKQSTHSWAVLAIGHAPAKWVKRLLNDVSPTPI